MALVKNTFWKYHENMQETNIDNAVGRAITRLRKEKRWSQRDLASHLHVNQAMVVRWEKGYTAPREETLDRISSALGLTTRELLGQAQSEPIKLNQPARDQELMQLLSQIHTLENKDIEALKLVLDAILTKSRIRNMVNAPSVANIS